MRDYCRQLPSLKKASKTQAILGIILSIIILFLGAGANFLLANLGSAPEYNGSNWREIQMYDAHQIQHLACGFIFLAIGTLLLIYNLVFLDKVRANRGAGVFKVIKVGCLISLYIELITNFSYLVLYSIIFRSGRAGWLPFGILLPQSLFLLLTVLGIYGIHGGKPKIVSAYIYIKGIFNALAIILFLVLMILFYGIGLLIIPFLLLVMFVYYYLKIFALQVNMMDVSSVQPNHHQLINTSEDKV